MAMLGAATLSTCSSKAGSQLGTGASGTLLVNSRAVSQRVAPLQPCVSFRTSPQRRLLRGIAKAQPTEKPLEQYVDYEGRTSVFPDEACEDTGEGCGAEGIGKEVLPTAAAVAAKKEETPGVDREYEEYSGEKTVFPGEACEELGGEFCGPDFQKGVFPEKASPAK